LAVFSNSRPARAAAFGEGEYFLGPEDVIQVWIYKEPDLSTAAVVRPDGKLSLPLIGEFEARGKSALQLQDEIRGRLQSYLTDPVVTVIVKEINSPKISVLGRVNRPDVYTIKQKTSVLEAIAMAGGFTEYAKRDHVTVIRPTTAARQQRIEVDLKSSSKNSTIYLQPFDTIYVE
jgi:polysaccharide export outer membrane protein